MTEPEILRIKVVIRKTNDGFSACRPEEEKMAGTGKKAAGALGSFISLYGKRFLGVETIIPRYKEVFDVNTLSGRKVFLVTDLDGGKHFRAEYYSRCVSVETPGLGETADDAIGECVLLLKRGILPLEIVHDYEM